MKPLKTFAGSAVIAGLLLSAGGCELIVAPDRSQITGGTGGGGTGGGGTGGMPTGGGGTGGTTGGGGTGGTTGGGGTGGMPCVVEDDMKECTDDVCDDATMMTTHTPKTAGDACTEGGGTVCDGNGECVGCLQDANCTSPQVCDVPNTTCVDPTCTDAKQDGDETDVDCGGSCGPCMDGLMCAVAGDCMSGVCEDNGSGVLTCQTAGCGDGVKNGDETDVDCGGSCAADCADGLLCLLDADCVSGVCADDGMGTLKCAVPVCGDGVTNGTDGCDDGNMVNGDGCDNNCKPSGCGNGEVDPATEECDDENNTNGDGCDNNCKTTACGNGIATMGEQCDDGNTASGDGCDANCTNTGCGNMIVTMGEGCDDGNLTDGDGCDSNCTNTACGNGVVTMGEACDDGNTVNGDGCDNNCTVSVCGNGQAGGTEQCDDGNTTNGDGCDNNCTTTACGNGITTMGEACDDGNTANSDGCSSACAVEPGYYCQGTTPTVCALPEILCGDGLDNNGAFGSDAADPSCALPAYVPACAANTTLRVYPNNTVTAIPDSNATGITSNVSVAGAGQVASGAIVYTITHTYDADLDISLVTPTPTTIDVCSDNGSNGVNFTNTVLSPACATAVTSGTAPFSGCYTPENAAQVAALAGKNASGTWGLKVVDDAAADTGDLQNWKLVLCTTVCGDNTIAGAETCDDGNLIDGDGCDSNCKMSACGNGIKAGAEGCDDGNTANNDGCDSTCAIELGYNCTGTPSVCTTTCGDGVKAAAEGCDDGNTTNGDGCTSTCTVQSGYTCTGTTPSVCTPNCGNGTFQTGEICDDGNTTNGDGCSSACVVEPGYFCQSGAPSVCFLPEVQCSDGLDNNGVGGIDAADPSCVLPGYFPACGAGEKLVVVPSQQVFAVPDGNVTGITSNVTVSTAGKLTRTAMVFNITHAYNSDLDISLVTPVPTTIDICSDNGLSSDNFTNTVLSTACASPVTGGTGPFSGCYSPENAATVNGLNGGSPNGTWGLKVVDDATPDPGILNSWSLALCTAVCGDGLKAASEPCDDGNTSDGDGCSSTCTVETGFSCTGQGAGSCTAYASCNALHTAQPALADGDYPIDPDGAGGSGHFTVRCDMTTSGGGWTLAFNDGTTFDHTLLGATAQTGYTTNYVSLAYSTVPIGADVMIDVSDTAISGGNQEHRSVIAGVPAATAGKTMRQIFTGAGLFFYDAEDNTNVTNTGLTCGSFGKWADYEGIVCGTAVLASNDDSGASCPGITLTLGWEQSYTVDQDNCAGWPQNPNHLSTNYFPDNFRVWVR